MLLIVRLYMQSTVCCDRSVDIADISALYRINQSPEYRPQFKPIFMPGVATYLANQPPSRQPTLRYLHDLLTKELGLEPKIRYSVPFYYGHSWICYLNPVAEERIELAFMKGWQLSNVQGILLSKDRKQVRGIDFAAPTDVPREVLLEVLQEALLLDELAVRPKKK